METDEEKRREIADNELVDGAFQKLLDTYLKSPHRKKVDKITKAFNFAKQAHKGVRRLSGEPYIMHPIAVAQIAAEEVGLGSTSIAAALLHDVVEDTDYTVEDIENIFGEKVAQIVDGLTKISGGIFGDKASAQTANFKKLLLTMSDDIRVILIKICDRLHNMRTLQSQPANKQYKIAGETQFLYAPLANRLGLNKIKSELENLSFKYEHPDTYAAIEAKLASSAHDRQALFDDFTGPIEASLKKLGIDYKIRERVKTPYSIWNKMQTKHVAFEDIYDIMAIRLIIKPKSLDEEIRECFNVYVAISQLYESHPDRLRDWLNHPKSNGYQALHVTLMSKKGQWIEVQIRSERMDDIAEQGFAAHWKYKEHEDDEANIEDDTELNNWLRTIKEILDDPQPDAMDFLDAIKLNLFASEIFVFTPKGEIKTMPADCTALDFAFSIHSFLGSHCIGAKVNHKLVPLSHKLKSGDQVEILTSKSQHVQPSWINFVSTAKAKAKVQAILRHDSRELQHSGEKLFEDFLRAHDIQATTMIADQIAHFHGFDKREELFQALGEKKLELGDRDMDMISGKGDNSGKKGKWRRFVPFLKSDGTNKNKPLATQAKEEEGLFTVPEKFNKKQPVILTDSNIHRYIMMECCHPIPGDDALGYIDNDKHIEIHKRHCLVANKLKASYGPRILDVKWDMSRTLFFDATIQIKGIDRMGIIMDIAKILTEQLGIYIRRIEINVNEGLFDGSIDLRVHDRKDLNEIATKLKAVESLKEVIS